MVELIFECTVCGKGLGVYQGKLFYLTFSDIGKPPRIFKVICEDCWEKRMRVKP